MKKAVLTMLFALFGVSEVGAAIIDFETVPGGTPADRRAISTQYAAEFGVSFGLDGNGDRLPDSNQFPYLEARGELDSGQGFYNDALAAYDVEAPGFEGQLGGYYLRIGTDKLMTAPAPALIVSYVTPVRSASAEIWDIDGHDSGIEQWVVTALDYGRNPIATISSPPHGSHGPESLDGKPWMWSLDLPAADIHYITVSFAGTKTRGIGLAFNNFSPSEPALVASAVPLPAAFWLFATGLVSLLGVRGLWKKIPRDW